MGFEDVSDCLQIPTVAPRGKIWHSPGVLIPRHPPYLPSDCTSNGWWAVKPEDLSWWRSCRPWWRRHSGANCKTRMFWTQHMWRGSSCCDRYEFRASFPLPVFLNSSQCMWWLSLSLSLSPGPHQLSAGSGLPSVRLLMDSSCRPSNTTGRWLRKGGCDCQTLAGVSVHTPG